MISNYGTGGSVWEQEKSCRLQFADVSNHLPYCLYVRHVNQGLPGEGGQAWSSWVPGVVCGQGGLSKDLLSEPHEWEAIPRLTPQEGQALGSCGPHIRLFKEEGIQVYGGEVTYARSHTNRWGSGLQAPWSLLMTLTWTGRVTLAWPGPQSNEERGWG